MFFIAHSSSVWPAAVRIGSRAPRRSGVSMVPGQTQFTLILNGPTSFAVAWVMRITPAFVAQ
jgi:hypothetical protein